MLVGLLSIIFNLLFWVLTILSWALLIYVIMTLIVPQNKYTLLVGRYIEPVLAPIRSFLRRALPGVFKLGIDVSPIGLWLLINIAEWALRLVKQVLIG